MHVIAGKFVCKPECRKDMLALVEEVLEPSRAESGCISYSFYEDGREPNHFLFFEEWASREAIDNHFGMPYFKKFMDSFPALIVGKASIRIYDVGSLEEF